MKIRKMARHLRNRTTRKPKIVSIKKFTAKTYDRIWRLAYRPKSKTPMKFVLTKFAESDAESYLIAALREGQKDKVSKE